MKHLARYVDLVCDADARTRDGILRYHCERKPIEAIEQYAHMVVTDQYKRTMVAMMGEHMYHLYCVCNEINEDAVLAVLKGVSSEEESDTH